MDPKNSTKAHRCLRCQNHGISVSLKQHARTCAFFFCKCTKCARLANKRARINEQRKAKRNQTVYESTSDQTRSDSPIDLSPKSPAQVQQMCIDSTLMGLQPCTTLRQPSSESTSNSSTNENLSISFNSTQQDFRLQTPPIKQQEQQQSISFQTNNADRIRMSILINSLVEAYRDIFKRMQ